jgi:lysylphosphatidylglycerol synthetase-like protein (DUF2156 family)
VQAAELKVPLGARVFVFSDLLLTAQPTTTSQVAAAEVALALDAWEGPGVVVFAGGLFDLVTEGNATAASAIAAHPKLLAALRRYSNCEGRQLVWLPGARELGDTNDQLEANFANEIAGALVAESVELDIATGVGTRRVRVEPGSRVCPSAHRSFRGNDAIDDQHGNEDPPPAPTPKWLNGVELVDDVARLPRFLTSRLLYRQLGRWWWLLFIPFTVAIVVKLPLSFALDGRLDRSLGPWSSRLGLLALTTAIDLVLVAALVFAVVTRGWRLVAGPSAAGASRNNSARAEARRVIATGTSGFVVGHTQVPELANLRSGFFANPGACTEVISERPGRGRLPPVFLVERMMSWLEMDAGAELHVRLLHGRVDAPGASLIERLAAQPREGSRPEVVATFPDGESWPATVAPSLKATKIRRRASAAILLAGLMDIAAILTPPLESRLRWVLHWVPLAVPQAATAAVAMAGLGLIFLARGVRRGQRDAWRIAVGLLVGTVALHLVKGGDLEEALAAIVVATYLVAHHRQFQARRQRVNLRRDVLATATMLPIVVIGATVAVEAVTAAHGGRIPIATALHAALERLIGMSDVTLPRRLDQFLRPGLLAITVGVVARLAWMFVRPVAARHGSIEDRRRARSIVKRWGAGTLDYFGLRADKQHFFWGSSVVAYGVHNGVCLVSPDPIGPSWEHDQVWAAFRRFADRQSWIVAVLGVSDTWLPTYRASGMHDLYVGDEGLVDVDRFSLEGGRHKSLRQAVNRVAKYGYTISFHDPSAIDAETKRGIEAIMDKSRRGDVERGFSMTLGRVFDPTDEGLLLAVCHAPDGHPVAFCQYVPAPGINGYSLDLMRRDNGEHPNGLLDFVIVETIRRLQANGQRRLSLNFATMRAVLAGETDNGLVTRVERWALKRMSGAMQIESLWRFNAKFDPDWHPRYIAYDSPEHVIPVAIAVARAESFWELPLIGRFLTPSEPNATPAEHPAPEAEPVLN